VHLHRVTEPVPRHTVGSDTLRESPVRPVPTTVTLRAG
jgi:hypothetical protein